MATLRRYERDGVDSIRTLTNLCDAYGCLLEDVIFDGATNPPCAKESILKKIAKLLRDSGY